MTIDEAIAHAREEADIARGNIIKSNNLDGYESWYNSQCIKCAEEHEQLAEWLEELKEYRKHIKLTEIPKQYKLGFQDGIVSGFENVYNNAIDDFYNALANDLIWIKERFGDDVYTDLWCSVGTRAEQLKAGGENGKLSF